MALWSIYIESHGYPLYVDVEFDDEYTEDEVWERVHEDLIIEVTKSG
jgi:hypothetical protein